ncbi:ABC transporter substrate-binding protein [Labilibaculum sp.]|uniref:ABC transporter substrate-binding protein n=1 Tax=Labilibaculum sp. TaxID=2060723 RepID=UPI003565F32E
MTDFITATDDLGNKIRIPIPAKRIISLVPSTTEFLFDLGKGEQLISRTRFCKYPKDLIAKLPNIGGPKNLYLDKINLLNPDLILANEEENSKAQIEVLQQEYPVYVCKIRNFEDALENILKTGKILGTEPKAYRLTNEIRSAFSKIPKPQKTAKILYLIWKDPYMAVGKNTFINSMIEKCGFTNAIEAEDSRYPQLSQKEIVHLNPNMIFLSSEPFPFQQKHIQEIQTLLPNTKIELVDGEMFSWYESHLLKAAPYIEDLIEKINSNPE